MDESGDFGEVKERPAYYLVTFVFHSQDNDIGEQDSKLEEWQRGIFRETIRLEKIGKSDIMNMYKGVNQQCR